MDSKKLEHGCTLITAGVPSFSGFRLQDGHVSTFCLPLYNEIFWSQIPAMLKFLSPKPLLYTLGPPNSPFMYFKPQSRYYLCTSKPTDNGFRARGCLGFLVRTLRTAAVAIVDKQDHWTSSIYGPFPLHEEATPQQKRWCSLMSVPLGSRDIAPAPI